MKNRTWIAGCVALALLVPQAALAGADLNVVKALDVSASGGEGRVILSGSKSPTFTVFKLSDPSRVVIDLAGTDVSAVRGPRDGAGPIAGVTVSQFADERASVGRVVVALAADARYDVHAEGESVVVAVNTGAAATADTAPAASTVAESAAPEAAPASNAERSAPAATAAATEPGVVATRIDEKVVENPGERVSGVKFNHGKQGYVVNILTDGAVGTYQVTELRDPPRLALDLFGFRRASRDQRAADGAPIAGVRFGKHEDKVRVVVDGTGDSLPGYEVLRTAQGLRIVLPSEQQAVASATKAAPAAEPARSTKTSAIRDIAFKGDERGGRVVISVGKGTEYRVERPDARTAILTIEGASLPSKLERSLDTSAFGGPIKMVSSFSAPGQSGTVQVVATLERPVSDQVNVDRAGALVWEFGNGASEATASSEIVLDGRKVEIDEQAVSAAPKASAFSADAAGYSVGASARRKYTGRRVSFEFKDIDIHNLLRIIAEVSKRNVIVADNVKGEITIKLRNVPWDQALDLILKSKGLDKEEIGNIIRVAPAKELEEERKMAAERKKSQEELEPLKVRLIPVNYATATEISTRVKDLLSPRGTMNVDTRTNVIIVKDTLEALARAEGLVRRLDTQTPQVLIESRIVEANTSFSRDFGIQWGGNISFSPATGNPTGMLFPNIVRMAGASSSEGTLGTSDTPNYAVNMPAAIGTGAGGGVGFIFGSAGGAVALNLRLSAMESAGQIKTISAPKITTLDNNSATIGQGVSIPFSQASANGVNTTFVEAKLELKVTPHVTADGSVLLDINATNNQPDPGTTGANGQPSISKKEAKTQVLVKDGDTTVIGGIYTRSTALSESAVPVLSKIPVLGWLFKKNTETDNRTELLIFVTPRIINRNQMVSAGEMAAQ